MMKSFLLPFAALLLLLGSACNESEPPTKGEVLDQFDENSPRGSAQDEAEEDSAIVTGTPIETD